MNVVQLLDFTGRRKTPNILQSEATECGLACLAMVAAHHGLEIDLPTLRRQFPVSLHGTTLKAMIQIADDLGFSSRALRADISSLNEVRLPAVLHWNLNHFIVLVSIRSSLQGAQYHINDPATGSRTISREEVSQSFTGVILELSKTNRFQVQRAVSKLRVSQLWSSVAGAGATLAAIIVLSSILELASLAMPLFLQLGIDSVIPSDDSQLLKTLAYGFAGLAIINVLATWLRQIALLNMTNAFSFQIIDNLYQHLLSLPLAWFEKRHVGDVVSRFGSTQPVTEFISQGPVSAVIDGVMVFITLILMFFYSPLLASIALIAWISYTALKLISFSVIRRSSISSITATARESSAFIETVRGIATIKASGQESTRRRTWQALKASAVNSQLKLGRITARFEAANAIVLAGERVFFVYFAISLAMKGGFTIGMIFAFQAYKEQFLGSSTRLIDQGLKFRLIDVHLGRIADIALSRPERHALRPRADLSRRLNGEIELRGVWFRYGVGDPYILRDVNLRIEAQEMVALVGTSGSGKTTLLKLIMGLLEPTSGMVLVDGIPLQQYGVQSWRRNIGSVLQEDRLFTGTLIENISFFDPQVDIARVRLVCRAAAIEDEIEKMPLGLETLVADLGMALSGGQRQRVILARALYGHPKVIVMDEGTTHLDRKNEEHIASTIMRYAATRIIIAHQGALIDSADRVVLVHEGLASEVRPAAS